MRNNQALGLLVVREGMIKEQKSRITLAEATFKKRKKPQKLEFSTHNIVNALEDGINRYKQVNNMAAKIRKGGDNTGRFPHSIFFPIVERTV